DLHDVIAGHLSSIAIHSTAALSRDVDPAVRESLIAIRTGSTAALTEMRAMIDVLHADAADPACPPSSTTRPTASSMKPWSTL
ncbi:histidine kinase dimerization/phosphoacceptor domain-containing protein, partial [Rhodococcoides corynebacterioides]|uniref:histidine kinase dimerization/phosphoacceptor domain-containing protein n=1 Tax=Rhodococcoides corynebacterioides TaxID=53972 RepID=UPI000B316B75